MREHTSLGNNRTGAQRSPIDTATMLEAAQRLSPADEAGDGEDAMALRRTYLDGDADDPGLGSLPPPLTLKGVVKAGADMVTGKRPQVLLDKLGERAAYERAGTRLYDGLIAKAEACADDLPAGALLLMREFRDEEAEHFQMVVEAVRQLGGDPTAQTPCADLVGVEGAGLMQAMNDPRISLPQALHVMFDAELIDKAAWEMLIALAEESGHEEIARRFVQADAQERRHLEQMREWVMQLTREDAGLRKGKGA